MKVRIISQGEYDRHEAEVRFTATADGRSVGVTVTSYALFIIREALDMPPADPLIIYAASGRLLETVVAHAIESSDEPLNAYLITHQEVLRVTGNMAGGGNPHVPNRWKF